jgi:choline dehydrogenase
VGATGAPEGSELLGVYYPRAGTLGGCSTHNVSFGFDLEATRDLCEREEKKRKER